MIQTCTCQYIDMCTYVTNRHVYTCIYYTSTHVHVLCLHSESDNQLIQMFTMLVHCAMHFNSESLPLGKEATQTTLSSHLESALNCHTCRSLGKKKPELHIYMCTKVSVKHGVIPKILQKWNSRYYKQDTLYSPSQWSNSGIWVNSLYGNRSDAWHHAYMNIIFGTCPLPDTFISKEYSAVVEHHASFSQSFLAMHPLTCSKLFLGSLQHCTSSMLIYITCTFPIVRPCVNCYPSSHP